MCCCMVQLQKEQTKSYTDYFSDLDLILIIEGISDNIQERIKKKQDMVGWGVE